MIRHQRPLTGWQHIRPIPLMLLDLHLLVGAQAQIFDRSTELLFALSLLLVRLGLHDNLILGLHEPVLGLVWRVLGKHYVLILILGDGLASRDTSALEAAAESGGVA